MTRCRHIRPNEERSGRGAAALPSWPSRRGRRGRRRCLVIVLPFFFDSGSAFIDDCTLALAYVVMALGLNIIVGFAGLLDLGYVAFFAIGAYTIGWFGSTFFADANGGRASTWPSHRAEPARAST